MGIGEQKDYTDKTEVQCGQQEQTKCDSYISNAKYPGPATQGLVTPHPYTLKETLAQRIYMRRDALRAELREVNEAVNLFESDQNIDNLMKVFKAAQYR